MATALRAAAILAALLAVSAPGRATAQTETVRTESGPVQVETVLTGFRHPWALAFLPDGRMLVTERPGWLRVIGLDGAISEPLRGVPAVLAEGQGGLLDVAVGPDFASDRRIYLSYAEPGEGGASTAVARGRLGDGGLEDVEVVFRQLPKMAGSKHFGSRLAFAPDGSLFVTTGDRYAFEPAQDLGGHIGKVLRIRPDGSVPGDNPFAGRRDARPEIWSYGHRNVQGAAVNPASGTLWIHEMGPRGGDELNLPKPGANHGWPLVSWGDHYDGTDIPDPPTRPDLAGSLRHWTPVIAPSGMAFYTGDRFPAWRGGVLVGGLVSRGLVRLTLDGDRVVGEERIPLGARIRDVRQAPDGTVWALTDERDGRLLRLTPG